MGRGALVTRRAHLPLGKQMTGLRRVARESFPLFPRHHLLQITARARAHARQSLTPPNGLLRSRFSSVARTPRYRLLGKLRLTVAARRRNSTDVANPGGRCEGPPFRHKSDESGQSETSIVAPPHLVPSRGGEVLYARPPGGAHA